MRARLSDDFLDCFLPQFRSAPNPTATPGREKRCRFLSTGLMRSLEGGVAVSIQPVDRQPSVEQIVEKVDIVTSGRSVQRRLAVDISDIDGHAVGNQRIDEATIARVRSGSHNS